MGVAVKLQAEGVIVLPRELQRKYDFEEGSMFTVIDLGEGALLLVPGKSNLARFGDKVAQIMEEEGVSLEEMLEGLRKERERYYREHYEKA